MDLRKQIGFLSVVLSLALTAASPVRAAAQGADPLAVEPAAAAATSAAPEPAGADLALLFGGLGAIGFVTLRRGRGD